MRLKTLVMTAAVALLAPVRGSAQVTADLVAALGISVRGILIVHPGAGAVIIGENLWLGNERRLCALPPAASLPFSRTQQFLQHL